MNEAEKLKLSADLMVEFAEALNTSELAYDVSSPSAYCASVEAMALKSAVAAFQTWMMARSLTHSVRVGEGN